MTGPGVVRLGVNIAEDVAEFIRVYRIRHNVTVTETIRHWAAIAKVVDDAHNAGHRVAILEGKGRDMTYRVITPPKKQRTNP